MVWHISSIHYNGVITASLNERAFVADAFNTGNALWLRWLNTFHTLYIVKLLLAIRLWADAFYEICGLSAGRRFTQNPSAIKRAGQAFTRP
ncbi:hypothetical protein, partial [Cronobacter sakazakii]|uniref:hypothetical protein n=1 Tax=Cronobacter sakazakii TaxID=28141 RepID=UPI001F50FF63